MSDAVAFDFPDISAPAAVSASEAAQARGFAAGYAEGARKAEQELATFRAELAESARIETVHAEARLNAAVQILARATEAVDATVLPVIDDSEAALLRAAMQIAEAVIGAELSDGDTSARSALTRAFAHPASPAVQTVHLNPADHDILHRAGLLVNGVKFVSDDTLARGDARATLPTGFVDASVGAAVDRVRTELLGGNR